MELQRSGISVWEQKESPSLRERIFAIRKVFSRDHVHLGMKNQPSFSAPEERYLCSKDGWVEDVELRRSGISSGERVIAIRKVFSRDHVHLGMKNQPPFFSSGGAISL